MEKITETTNKKDSENKIKIKNYSKKESIFSRLAHVLGVILILLLVGLPKDLWRWLRLKRKCVRGKTVVITGGASGIGKRMAELFADPEKFSAQVAIIDRNLKGAEQVAQGIKNLGGNAEAWECDISEEEEMKKCAKEIIEKFGTVDIVICNAAVLYFALINELKSEEIKNALNVNVIGTINTIRAFLPNMERNKSGQIVSICSITGFFGETFGMAYCPTKFAVRGSMECLRMELRDKGLEEAIKCTTICPYFVRTPMILNRGLRPISRWIPFMSIERCTLGIIDAILKEKVLVFIPSWLNVLVMLHNSFSLNMQRTSREFINFRFENNSREENSEEEINKKEILKNQKSNDYFESAEIFWFILIPPAMLLIFLAYINPELINLNLLSFIGQIAYKIGTEYPQLLLFINILAWIAHITEASFALNLSDSLHLTHKSSFLWFLQTLLLGYPSLRILLRRRKMKDEK
ncbi:hypothetical protein ACQ4LE_003052 [Meloidogyne hapla]